MGSVARHVGSSWTRDWTRVYCIGGQILYHWATSEARGTTFFWQTLFESFAFWALSLNTEQPASWSQAVFSRYTPESSHQAAVPFQKNGLPRCGWLCKQCLQMGDHIYANQVSVPADTVSCDVSGKVCLSEWVDRRWPMRIFKAWHNKLLCSLFHCFTLCLYNCEPFTPCVPLFHFKLVFRYWYHAVEPPSWLRW